VHDAIKAKLLLSDDDLLAEVGQSIGKGATFTDALRRGRQVFENLKRELRETVCSNATVITCYKGAKEDSVLAVAAIIDAISSSLHGIPPATIGTLLYRAGLRGYCGLGWPPEK
jgi:hypothetical protein